MRQSGIVLEGKLLVVVEFIPAFHPASVVSQTVVVVEPVRSAGRLAHICGQLYLCFPRWVAIGKPVHEPIVNVNETGGLLGLRLLCSHAETPSHNKGKVNRVSHFFDRSPDWRP